MAQSVRNLNNPFWLVFSITSQQQQQLNLTCQSTWKVSSCSSDYHSHSFIIQMRLPETDSSLLPVHQSADPKQSSTASQTQRAYITPTSAHSLPTYAGAHIYAAQTPHATETVKNTSAPSSRGKILLRCRNSRSPSRDASPIRPPPISQVHTVTVCSVCCSAGLA